MAFALNYGTNKSSPECFHDICLYKIYIYINVCVRYNIILYYTSIAGYTARHRVGRTTINTFACVWNEICIPEIEKSRNLRYDVLSDVILLLYYNNIIWLRRRGLSTNDPCDKLYYIISSFVPKIQNIIVQPQSRREPRPRHCGGAVRNSRSTAITTEAVEEHNTKYVKIRKLMYERSLQNRSPTSDRESTKTERSNLRAPQYHRVQLTTFMFLVFKSLLASILKQKYLAMFGMTILQYYL